MQISSMNINLYNKSSNLVDYLNGNDKSAARCYTGLIPVKNFFSNPFKPTIMFKGNLKEDTLDLNNSKKEKIEKLKKDAILETQKKIKEIETQKSKYEQDLIFYYDVTNFVRDLFTSNEHLRSFKNEIKNSDESQKDKLIDELLASHEDAKSDKISNCAKKALRDCHLWGVNTLKLFGAATIFTSKTVQGAKIYIEKAPSRISALKASCDKYIHYLDINPDVAPCFNPFIDPKTKLEMLKENGIVDKQDLLGFIENAGSKKQVKDVMKLLEKNQLIKFGEDELKNIPDMTDETTKATVEILKQHQGNLKLPEALSKELSITIDALDSIGLSFIEIPSQNKSSDEAIRFVDMADPKNKEKLDVLYEEVARIRPKRSKYYSSSLNHSSEPYVPILYLQKIGYGPIGLLKRLVQDGKLKGKIESVDTLQGRKTKTMVDVNDMNNYKLLLNIKENNPNIILAPRLAKEVGISNQTLINLIKKGEIDIIGEYIFPYEIGVMYIDRTTEKNTTAIKQLQFEKELALQLKEDEKKQKELERIENKDRQAKMASMRMKLVWYFCPKTREIASQMASQDGYLARLFAKEKDSDEELTPKEEVIVNQYRKNVWNSAGSEELKEGFKKAEEVLKKYYQSGLESIENEEIREIIKMYENN